MDALPASCGRGLGLGQGQNLTESEVERMKNLGHNGNRMWKT
ncbi:hypothetical protein ACFQ36_04200 [Arthrobacter sp. GCM10027362]